MIGYLAAFLFGALVGRLYFQYWLMYGQHWDEPTNAEAFYNWLEDDNDQEFWQIGEQQTNTTVAPSRGTG